MSKTVDFNLLFVAGLPRSGTTMVQNILDSHPEIYGGPEFDRIPNFIDLRRKLIWSVEAGRINLYTHHAEIDRVLHHAILQLLIPKTDKAVRWISEKTPWNILVFQDLAEMFPDARFIHVLRNPLDVWRSMKNVARNAMEKSIKPPDFTLNAGLALNYMQTVYSIAAQMEEKYPQRFKTIKFEDVFKNLEAENKGLCDFLNLNWHSDMLQFHNLPHPGEETMTKDGVWYTKDKFARQISSDINKEIVPPQSDDEWLLTEVLGSNSYLADRGYNLHYEQDATQKRKVKEQVNNYVKNVQKVPMPARFLP